LLAGVFLAVAVAVTGGVVYAWRQLETNDALLTGALKHAAIVVALHIKPSRTIFSSVLNLRRSAIAALVRSPWRYCPFRLPGGPAATACAAVQATAPLLTNAGHNPPYHLRAQGAEPITAPKGRPLGTRRDSAYKTGHLRLVPGEAIYLYTDGITEAANRTDEMFTEQRLEAILREASPFRPKDVIQAVADAVQSFANSVPQSDDITAMAIRLLAR
jgi:hypothetical protein